MARRLNIELSVLVTKVRQVVFLAALLGSVVLVVSAGALPAAAPTPVIGVVRTGSTWSLRPLDPRTLQPLRGSWSQRAREAQPIRSPRGTRVAANRGKGEIVVDSRTGSIVARGQDGAILGVGDEDLYWFGGEKWGRGGAALLWGFLDAGSIGGLYYHFFDLLTGAEGYCRSHS